MISLFRKHFASRLAVQAVVSTGILAGLGLVGAPSALAQAATRMQLSTESNNGVLSFTASVNDFQGQPVSEGSVSFETSKGSLGSAFVHDGTATLNLTNPPAWARNITAVYHGDTAFAPASASTQVTSDASSTVPGFTVTANPTSFSLNPGDSEPVSLTITSQNGFTGQVNLSCSGLVGATMGCTFTPTVVTPAADGTAATSSLQITTQAPSGILTSRAVPPSHSSITAWAFVFPGLLALAGIGAVRRRNFGILRALGIAMLLSAGALGLTACNPRYSYEHYKPSPNLGTPAGNYTVVISAYSSNGTSITQATSSDPSCSGAVCLSMTVK